MVAIAQSGTTPKSRKSRNASGRFHPRTPENAYPRISGGLSGHRFYSPNIGRWLSRDPIEEGGGANVYCFVLNNGIMYVDAYGNATFQPWIFVKGAAGVVGGGVEVVTGFAVGAGGTIGSAGTLTALAGAGAIALSFDGGYRFGRGWQNIRRSFRDADALPSSFLSDVGSAVAGGTGEKVGDVLDLAISIPSGRVTAQYLVKSVCDISDVATAGDIGVTLGESVLEITGTSPSPSPGPRPPTPRPPGPTPTPPSGAPVKLRIVYIAQVTCPAKFAAYQTQNGDNLWNLWRRRPDASVTWAEMLDANKHLKDPNRIRIREPICVVKCGTQTTP